MLVDVDCILPTYVDCIINILKRVKKSKNGMETIPGYVTKPRNNLGNPITLTWCGYSASFTVLLGRGRLNNYHESETDPRTRRI